MPSCSGSNRKPGVSTSPASSSMTSVGGRIAPGRCRSCVGDHAGARRPGGRPSRPDDLRRGEVAEACRLPPGAELVDGAADLRRGAPTAISGWARVAAREDEDALGRGLDRRPARVLHPEAVAGGRRSRRRGRRRPCGRRTARCAPRPGCRGCAGSRPDGGEADPCGARLSSGGSTVSTSRTVAGGDRRACSSRPRGRSAAGVDRGRRRAPWVVVACRAVPSQVSAKPRGSIGHGLAEGDVDGGVGGRRRRRRWPDRWSRHGRRWSADRSGQVLRVAGLRALEVGDVVVGVRRDADPLEGQVGSRRRRAGGREPGALVARALRRADPVEHDAAADEADAGEVARGEVGDPGRSTWRRA